MNLHGGFVLTVLRPLYAPERELDCRGAYRIDVAQLEARKPSRMSGANEGFILLSEVVVHYPEELFHDKRISRPVGDGERVEVG